MFNEDHVSQSPFLVSVITATDTPVSGMNYQSINIFCKILERMLSFSGYNSSCAPADQTQLCNGHEEASLSGPQINTTSDSSAEPVLLSDASKVICHGPGLSKGFLGRKNTFYVDCSKAGECAVTLAGMLL